MGNQYLTLWEKQHAAPHKCRDVCPGIDIVDGADTTTINPLPAIKAGLHKGLWACLISMPPDRATR